MPGNKFELAAAIFDLLERDLARAGFSLLDVRIFRGGGRLQVRIYLDTEAGITLDECAEASRTVGMLMEEADPVAERYVIEVSSPGIRRPLRKPEHFRAHRGERVELRLAGQSRRLRGVLREADETGLLLQPADDEGAAVRRIALADVLEANLDAEFDARALINADRRRRKEEKRQQRQRKRTRNGARADGRDDADTTDEDPSDTGAEQHGV